jgi:hypothetical protein
MHGRRDVDAASRMLISMPTWRRAMLVLWRAWEYMMEKNSRKDKALDMPFCVYLFVSSSKLLPIHEHRRP